MVLWASSSSFFKVMLSVMDAYISILIIKVFWLLCSPYKVATESSNLYSSYDLFLVCLPAFAIPKTVQVTNMYAMECGYINNTLTTSDLVNKPLLKLSSFVPLNLQRSPPKRFLVLSISLPSLIHIPSLYVHGSLCISCLYAWACYV